MRISDWSSDVCSSDLALGGLDLQILGIGRTGHIGFNEPGSAPNSGTRLVTLDDLTRRDASRDFGGKENVPTKAITMGIGTIFKARERSEENTSELQSLMRISYAVFCLKKKIKNKK